MIKKMFSWIITLVLVIFIGGVAFIYFTPAYSLKLVRSGSMTPSVRMGDIIITGPAGNPINGIIKPGSIVMYERNKELITHRVVSIDGDRLIMKGDALDDPDPWTVTRADVRGIYLFKIPYVGYALSFIQTKNGWFLGIIGPAAVLIGWLVWDILKETFKNENEPKTSKKKVKVVEARRDMAYRDTNQAHRDTLKTPLSNETSDLRRREADDRIREIFRQALRDSQLHQEQKGGEGDYRQRLMKFQMREK